MNKIIRIGKLLERRNPSFLINNIHKTIENTNANKQGLALSRFIVLVKAFQFLKHITTEEVEV